MVFPKEKISVFIEFYLFYFNSGATKLSLVYFVENVLSFVITLANPKSINLNIIL